MPEHNANCPTNLKRSRVTFFEKNGMIGGIFLACNETTNMVSTFDPRLEQPTRHKAFETADAADHWFREYVIATVTENFWSLRYNGARNVG
jgi:uncharacterized membrane protein